ncbi:unnamed protein product [Schistosoma guineensis]|nr:unnamed protein product [Schistosoma guineensis]CAH8642368.1 unnamed protein product [Schistosoma bovis]CAH8647672.1 unnamed protein product [Schistosoma bovis]
MIEDVSPFIQTVLGTGLTWFVTAIGSMFCFIISNSSTSLKNQILDGSLGFSSGIMLAASFWSLLEPALEMAKIDLGLGAYCVFPVMCGLFIGAAFVGLVDTFLPTQWLETVPVAINDSCYSVSNPSSSIVFDTSIKQRNYLVNSCMESNIRHRSENTIQAYPSSSSIKVDNEKNQLPKMVITRRLWLLIMAITVHNIPEGFAVGIAFGGLGQYSRTTFSQACNLAIGIAIQNFPEGLAVSLPLYSSGYGFFISFWYGQLSGLVEPFAGLIGCLAVHFFRRLQPYALGFAAGAMLFVVVDDIIPESQSRGHGRLSTVMALIGFAIMMCLEVVTET